MADKARIIELQRSLKIARTALEKIRFGHAHCPERTAEDALDAMRPLEPKTQLQGLVGHEPRRP
jgi:hypothetical protein